MAVLSDTNYKYYYKIGEECGINGILLQIQHSRMLAQGCLKKHKLLQVNWKKIVTQDLSCIGFRPNWWEGFWPLSQGFSQHDQAPITSLAEAGSFYFSFSSTVLKWPVSHLWFYRINCHIQGFNSTNLYNLLFITHLIVCTYVLWNLIFEES